MVPPQLLITSLLLNGEPSSSQRDVHKDAFFLSLTFKSIVFTTHKRAERKVPKPQGFYLQFSHYKGPLKFLSKQH